MIGAMVAGVLLMAGCGMVTVVSEDAPSDYALCIEKRRQGVSHELAALDCAEMAERAAPKSYKRRGTWAFFQEYRTS